MAEGLSFDDSMKCCKAQPEETKVTNGGADTNVVARGNASLTEMKFSLYFMGYEDEKDIPSDTQARTEWTFSRKATLELTHNWGTEDDPNFSYHNGNSEPRGFGHIGLMVPDVNAACARFEKLGVDFVKKPADGKMKGIAFIKDPDGYWIEIFNSKGVAGITS